MSLTHRERVLRAVNHEASDRMPRDLGVGFISTDYKRMAVLFKQENLCLLNKIMGLTIALARYGAVYEKK